MGVCGSNAKESQVHKEWIEYKGPNLDTALDVVPEFGGSPVQLVDATHLLRTAGYKKGDGKWVKRSPLSIIRFRQELPAEAFMSLSTLRKSSSFRGALRIMAVSYPWLQPDHPDPRGDSLGLLAYALASMMNDWNMRSDVMAVFLDFMSLHQRPPGGSRTPGENSLFDQGLKSLNEIYGHPYVWVFKISVLPPGYPDGFVFQGNSTPNKAAYYGRGWCYCESAVASLAKLGWLTLDLGKVGDRDARGFERDFDAFIEGCAASRPAPLVPEEFEAELQEKSFTSKKADFHKVAKIYKGAFQKCFGESTRLDYSGLGWGDAEVEALARVLAGGAVPSLEELLLDSNQIGTGGFEALAPAVRAGAVPRLRMVGLQDNPGDPRGLREAVFEQTPDADC